MSPSNAAAALAGLPVSVILPLDGVPLVTLADEGAGPFITSWSVPGVAQPTTAQWAAALAEPDPPPPLPQLQAAVMSAGSAATGSIVSQIAPDSTHQNAYQIASQMVWAANGAAPASGPAEAIFASYAADFGVTPAVLAARVVSGATGSLALSGALLTLDQASATATTSTQLATALAAFETTLTGIVASLTAAGLVVTAPAAISIPGVNA